MLILSIETSCDDTGIAILKCKKNSPPELLANLVSSQIKIHAPFGGVVPMLAKREHQRNLLPLLRRALKEANLLSPEQAPHLRGASKALHHSTSSRVAGLRSGNRLEKIFTREPELLKKLEPFLKKYQKPGIDALAVTIGPGLEPALWVGVNFARALAYFWNLPIIPVNHIEAHIAANFLPAVIASDDTRKGGEARQSSAATYVHGIASSSRQGGTPRNDTIFPAICLVVSGGHTQLILIKKLGNYEILGETRDDAAGEAFDKLARMLNLGYPGGPIVSREAAKFNSELRNYNFEIDSKFKTKNSKLILPRPMLNSGDFDFSFSGLKTAALYLIKKLSPAQIKKLTPAICAQFQQAVVDVLVAKTVAAAKKYQAKSIMLSGGVAANDALRETLKLKTDNLKLNFSVPPKHFCTDNAAMIALAASQKNQKKADWQNLKADANLRI